MRCILFNLIYKETKKILISVTEVKNMHYYMKEVKNMHYYMKGIKGISKYIKGTYKSYFYINYIKGKLYKRHFNLV